MSIDVEKILVWMLAGAYCAVVWFVVCYVIVVTLS